MFSKKWAVVLAVLVIGSMFLAACGPAPTPIVVKETVVVTKEVQKEVTKEVEKVVTKEVEKVVTKEVEKVVEVTPTPVDMDALAEAVGVRALDDYTVEFTLEHPA
ncbi:MAG: hypothetical protein ACUVXG_06795, partial [Anaerolineae bacterium]